MKSARLDVASYDVVVNLYIGKRSELRSVARRLFGEDFDKDSHGEVLFETRHFAILLRSKCLNRRLVLHECYHVVGAILRFRGCDYGFEYDEHAALLSEQITDWALTQTNQ